MRKYEMVVILEPAVDERTVSGTFEKLVQVIPTEGGTIDNVDVWGKRKFAYEIDKKTEGIYIVLTFTSKPQTAQELDRQLGLNESVMRTKLMRLDEKLSSVALRSLRPHAMVLLTWSDRAIYAPN